MLMYFKRELKQHDIILADYDSKIDYLNERDKKRIVKAILDTHQELDVIGGKVLISYDDKRVSLRYKGLERF